MSSRIRQYVDLQGERNDKALVANLQFELEASERRNLHLNKELLNETVLRTRSERQRGELTAQIESLRSRLDKEIRLDEGVKRPQRIEKGNQRTGDGGAVSQSRVVPKRTRGVSKTPVVTNVQGDRISTDTPEPRKSARTRGGVK